MKNQKLTQLLKHLLAPHTLLDGVQYGQAIPLNIIDWPCVESMYHINGEGEIHQMKHGDITRINDTGGGTSLE